MPKDKTPAIDPITAPAICPLDIFLDGGGFRICVDADDPEADDEDDTVVVTSTTEWEPPPFGVVVETNSVIEGLLVVDCVLSVEDEDFKEAALFDDCRFDAEAPVEAEEPGVDDSVPEPWP